MILNTIVSGDGPTLVLLHGLFGRAQNFGSLSRQLSARHRVMALDLRNHGASQHAAGMSYADMAGDVVETLSAAGALPANVLGHSMGGKVAMMLALLHPEKVSRLLVADIAPVAYAHHNKAVAEAMLGIELRLGLSRPGLSRSTAAGALADAVPDPAVRAFLLQNLSFGPVPGWRIGLQHIADGIADIEGWPDAGLVYDGPALFLAGSRSDYIVASSEAKIRRYFPAARIGTIADAGHWLHADQPAAFAEAVADFFANTLAGTA